MLVSIICIFYNIRRPGTQFRRECNTFKLYIFSDVAAANLIPVTMLGRKQSLKGEPIMADYGPEECLNENADIEWVNKVHLMRNSSC